MGENRPIDVVVLALALTILALAAGACLYSFWRSGKGDSISGRVHRWMLYATPLQVALFGSALGFLAGLVVGALLTHWAGWSASG